jgi:hypothetical protein
LRDRGYFYWRLLLTDPAAARAVVLCQKPLISEETDLLEPTLLDELICHISSLASVYHKPPRSGFSFIVFYFSFSPLSPPFFFFFFFSFASNKHSAHSAHYFILFKLCVCSTFVDGRVTTKVPP